MNEFDLYEVFIESLVFETKKVQTSSSALARSLHHIL